MYPMNMQKSTSASHSAVSGESTSSFEASQLTGIQYCHRGAPVTSQNSKTSTYPINTQTLNAASHSVHGTTLPIGQELHEANPSKRKPSDTAVKDFTKRTKSCTNRNAAGHDTGAISGSESSGYSGYKDENIQQGPCAETGGKAEMGEPVPRVQESTSLPILTNVHRDSPSSNPSMYPMNMQKSTSASHSAVSGESTSSFEASQLTGIQYCHRGAPVTSQ
ncbi:hypothetical protein AVEN_106071-1, partial [Araneus ventricosus]